MLPSAMSLADIEQAAESSLSLTLYSLGVQVLNIHIILAQNLHNKHHCPSHVPSYCVLEPLVYHGTGGP